MDEFLNQGGLREDFDSNLKAFRDEISTRVIAIVLPTIERGVPGMPLPILIADIVHATINTTVQGFLNSGGQALLRSMNIIPQTVINAPESATIVTTFPELDAAALFPHPPILTPKETSGPWQPGM